MSLFRKPISSFSLFPRVIDGCLPFILYIIYYIQDYFLYYILVCLSKVFQRTIFLSSSRFSGKAFAKVRHFFVTSKFFRKFFWKFFFRRFPEGVRLILSRSLAHPQGKILGAAVSTISRSLSSSSLSSSAALPLESGCKGTDFFLSCNFYGILFCNIFSGVYLTRWFSLCYKAYFLLSCENGCEIYYII